MGHINKVLSTKSIFRTVLSDQTGITKEFPFLPPGIAEKSFSLYTTLNFARHNFLTLGRRQKFLNKYRVSHKTGIDKKLLVGAAHEFNSQFLNLFGFSISVS